MGLWGCCSVGSAMPAAWGTMVAAPEEGIKTPLSLELLVQFRLTPCADLSCC